MTQVDQAIALLRSAGYTVTEPVFGAGESGVPQTEDTSGMHITGPSAIGGPIATPDAGWTDAQLTPDTTSADAKILQAEADAKRAAGDAEVARNKELYGDQSGGDFGQP